MPELPDIEAYLGALRGRVIGRTLERVGIVHPFLLRSVEPPIEEAEGKRVVSVSRLGKRIILGLEPDLFLVVHLMIAGRLLWKPPRTRPPARIGQAVFGFTEGSLILTEAGTKRRASLHLVRGERALAAHDPGGIDPLTADRAAFEDALRRENHTLKRALTDPRLFSGIGNAYSDEILHAARLSPVKLTKSLSADEAARLHAAATGTLTRWRDELCGRFKERFPGVGEITAFREGFAVHGRFGEPCPVCGKPVQRIRYAENETNYCAGCQTGGRVLADRSLSRLLKDDWPRSIDELEG